MGGPPLWRKPPRAGTLAPYQDHLDHRWTEGSHNAAQLWRELVERDFVGAQHRATVGGRRRKGEPKAVSFSATHNVAGGFGLPAVCKPVDDPKPQQNFVACLLKQALELAECIAVANRLTVVLCRNSKEFLDKALEDAGKTGLQPDQRTAILACWCRQIMHPPV
jgi:hypothetical protein